MKRYQTIICLLLLAAVLVGWAVNRWFGSNEVDIRGTVFGPDGKPASSAVVLVTVREYRFLDDVIPPCLYRCSTDRNGRFWIQEQAPIKVHGLRVEACTDDCSYAIDENPGRDVVLKTKIHGSCRDLAPHMRYQGFSGKFGSSYHVQQVENRE